LNIPSSSSSIAHKIQRLSLHEIGFVSPAAPAKGQMRNSCCCPELGVSEQLIIHRAQRVAQDLPGMPSGASASAISVHACTSAWRSAAVVVL
jgi:hypothetical protein